MSLMLTGVGRRTGGAAPAGDPTLKMHLDFAQNDGATIAAAITSGPSSLTFTRSSDGTNFDESGVMQTNTTNNPRYDHDPGDGDAALGILLEGAATNVCLQSEDFDTTWTKSVTLTTDDAVAPDGATTADKADDTGSGATENIQQNITIPDDSTSWCFSIFVKKTSADSHYFGTELELRGGSSQKIVTPTSYNTNTGAVGGTTGTDDTGVIDAGDYWRVWSVVSNNSSGNVTARLKIYPAFNTAGNASPSNAATGFKHVWGAQLENTAYPTSYIKTTSSSVTRVRDDLTTSSVSWMNADYSGSYVYEVSLILPVPADADRYLGEVRHISSSNLVSHKVQNGGKLRIDATGEVTPLTILGATVNPAGFHKFGIAIATTNDAELYVNGVSDGTDTAHTLPLNPPDTYHIGDRQGNDRPFLGHIKNIRYWDERKDDTFMNAETT